MKPVLRGLVLDLLNAGLMLQTGRPDDRFILLLGVRSWPGAAVRPYSPKPDVHHDVADSLLRIVFSRSDKKNNFGTGPDLL
jgi:hypothetical protein